MKSPLLWAYLYLFMAFSFIYFAIQQRGRTGEWDWFTLILMAIAAYDFLVSIKYFSLNNKRKKK